jgi:hypothetical protein
MGSHNAIFFASVFSSVSKNTSKLSTTIVEQAPCFYFINCYLGVDYELTTPTPTPYEYVPVQVARTMGMLELCRSTVKTKKVSRK